MGIALISFGAVFLLIASAGLLLFYREAMIQRIGEVVNPRAKKADLLSSIQQTGSSLGGFIEQLNRVLPKSDAEVSVIQKRLIRAGFRKDAAVVAPAIRSGGLPRPRAAPAAAAAAIARGSPARHPVMSWLRP